MTRQKKRLLRNKYTGRLFEYTELLARNPDLEEYLPDKDPVLVMARKKKEKTASPAKASRSTGQRASEEKANKITREELEEYLKKVKAMDDIRSVVSLGNRFAPANDRVTPDPAKNKLTLPEAILFAEAQVEKFYEGRVVDA